MFAFRQQPLEVPDVERKLAAFALSFRQKLRELDDIFQSVDERQGRLEENAKVQTEETRQMILSTRTMIEDQHSALSPNILKEVQARFDARESMFGSELRSLRVKLERLENGLLTERERLDQLQQISGLSLIDVEKKFDLKDEEVESRIENLSVQLADLKHTMENVHDKMYDFENSKKNNLIFYGIPREERESGKTLILKIKSLITNRLNIKRYIALTSATRLLAGILRECKLNNYCSLAGPEVNNCQPVVVTFEDVEDRHEIFKNFKLKRKVIGSF